MNSEIFIFRSDLHTDSGIVPAELALSGPTVGITVANARIAMRRASRLRAVGQ